MGSEKSTKNYSRRSMGELLAIPHKDDNTEDWDAFFEPLANASEFDVIDIRHDNISCSPTLYIKFKKEVYPINITWYEYSFNEDNIQQGFSTENITALQQATSGIKFSMLYTTDAQTSIHLLFKVICLLIPKLIGVYNCNTYTLLSPLWAKSAAAALTPPAPAYLYTIHSVCGDNKWLPFSTPNYWIHTHGLNCCGLPDLEIIGEISPKYYDIYSNLVYHLANYIISDGSLPAPKEGFHIGWTDNKRPIVITWLPWQEGLKNYKKHVLGGIEARDESHCQNTGIIFLYNSEKDCAKQKYSLITSIKESVMENPILFFTAKETKRLKAMAYEQISYLREGLQKEGSSAIAKISLTVDDEFKKEDSSNVEHIWFDIENITSDSITGTLIQEPYYIKDMHTGITGTYSTRLITDWKLYINEQIVTPDNIYLLELL